MMKRRKILAIRATMPICVLAVGLIGAPGAFAKDECFVQITKPNGNVISRNIDKGKSRTMSLTTARVFNKKNNIKVRTKTYQKTKTYNLKSGHNLVLGPGTKVTKVTCQNSRTNASGTLYPSADYIIQSMKSGNRSAEDIAAALKNVMDDPIAILKALNRAGAAGFKKFARNTSKHLLGGLKGSELYKTLNDLRSALGSELGSKKNLVRYMKSANVSAEEAAKAIKRFPNTSPNSPSASTS